MRLWRARSAPVVDLRFFAMGTAVSVTVAMGRSQRRHEAVEAIAEVERRIQVFGREAWPWGSGVLAAFNARLADGEAAVVPAALRPLFDRAWALREASGGAFDPRVAALVRLWGFDDIAARRCEPPPTERIEAGVAALSAAPPYVPRCERYGPAPGTGWDFGGIGKGWIVDRALEWLREQGFADAVVDAGGNLAVRGRRGDRPWHVGIRDPRSPADAPGLIASLAARDEAVNTHGDDQRGFEYQGRRYAHLLDPRTGWPAQGLRALTVVHADGALAEAGGAALFVAGPARWPALARALGLHQVLAVDADGELQATPALAARILRVADRPLRIVS